MNGTMGAELRHRVGEGTMVLGTSRNSWKESWLSLRAKMGVFDD